MTHSTDEKKPALGGLATGDVVTLLGAVAWDGGDHAEAADPPITQEMMSAGLRWMTDLDGPYCNLGDAVENVFTEMLAVVRATPTLRIAYQQWLAEFAPQD